MSAGESRPAPTLVLSLFPGIDLLGRAFEAKGFCVVRGPDLIWGSPVETFHAPPSLFSGVIAGPPCVDFSSANRSPVTPRGLALLEQTRRVIREAKPIWFLIENVPRAPDIHVEGYSHQRLDVRASEFGAPHRRLRHFQFGHAKGQKLALSRDRRVTETTSTPLASRPGRRSWPDLCALMGLPSPIYFPALTATQARRALCNGVHFAVASALASAIASPLASPSISLCECGCGRTVTPPAHNATPACRKRRQRARDAAAPRAPRGVTDLALAA